MQRRIATTAASYTKPIIIGLAGERRYLKLRRTGFKALRKLDKRRRQTQRRRSERTGFSIDHEVARHGDLLNEMVETMTPTKAAEANFRFVADALDAASVEWWLVEDYCGHGYRIGVDFESKSRAAAALMRPRIDTPIYVKAPETGAVALTEVNELGEDPDVTVITVTAPKKVRDTNWAFGFRYGCSIEFWTTTVTDSRVIVEAPAENRAAKLMSKDEFILEPTATESGRRCLTPSVLNQTMLEDITFPIDAGYTWVDGADPNWVESKRRLEAEVAGRVYHPEANHDARFESRDEL